jgi:hypothetical protein
LKVLGSLYTGSDLDNYQTLYTANGGAYLTQYIDSNGYRSPRLQLAYNNTSAGTSGTCWNIDSYQGALRIFAYSNPSSSISAVTAQFLPNNINLYVPTNIRGFADASAGSAGYVGEYITSAIAAGAGAVSLSSATYTVLTSISLTAGDWDVTAMVNCGSNQTALGTILADITTSTTATVSDGYSASGNMPVGTGVKSTVFVTRRVTISATATYNILVWMGGTYSAGACWGNISARRRR